MTSEELVTALNNGEVVTPFAVQYPVCPVHECEGILTKYTFEVIPYTDKNTGEPRIFGKLTAQFQLQSAIAEAAKGPNPTSSLSINVDLDESGNISTAVGRNIALGRFLTALGLNEPGTPYANMVGKIVRVKVDNITDDLQNGPVTSDYISGIYSSAGASGRLEFYRFTRKPRQLV